MRKITGIIMGALLLIALSSFSFSNDTSSVSLQNKNGAVEESFAFGHSLGGMTIKDYNVRKKAVELGLFM